MQYNDLNIKFIIKTKHLELALQSNDDYKNKLI